VCGNVANGSPVPTEVAEAPEYEAVPADATDHAVAEGMRDGRYASPTKYGDFWLFDLRITGTGAAWRDSLEEWALRDPDLWTSPEFIERCNGLAVIFGHPERSGLNHEEFKERSIGSIVLPYRKGDEVWGIAKIFNDDAALLMQTTHTSTSPGVTPPKGSTPVELNDGTQVLAEGLPLVLDHLAVCELGVWDKDGPPEGIRLDALSRKDDSVTAEEKAALEKERDDARARADSAEKERDDAKARADEFEKNDKARKDAEESDKEAIAAAEREKADKAKKDAADAKRDSRKDRHSKHDAKKDGDIMDCARCDSEESEEKERDDKARKDAEGAPKTPVDAERGTEIHDSKFAAMEARLKRQDEQLAAMTAQPSIEDSNEIAKAWGRWDSLYQMLNEQTPRAYPGEKPRAYLRRLADGVRPFTQSFQNYAFHDSQQATDFGLVADAIYSEALAHSKKPIMNKPGQMREVVTHPNGKTRTEFIGDHRAPWLPFAHPTKFAVVKINRPSGNVYSNQ
jgi:hypothetical protein